MQLLSSRHPRKSSRGGTTAARPILSTEKSRFANKGRNRIFYFLERGLDNLKNKTINRRVHRGGKRHRGELTEWLKVLAC